MARTVSLVLEDGSVYEGYSFGATVSTYGEVVFNTSMTGYQEMLTDPSYAGQILVLTYPLIGNYGISEHDFESNRIQVRALIVREDCQQPSPWQSASTLHQFLETNGIPGIYGVDTRSLTRRLRSQGVMMGAIVTDKSPEEALEQLRGVPRYDSIDFVKEVSTKAPYQWEPLRTETDSSPRIIVLDCGLKYNILRILRRLGCKVTAVPCTYSAEQILELKPDGILLSPGPGDPALLGHIVDTVKKLVGTKPIMGICLGEQLIGRAFGATTFKLKFGHRGGNHPVRDLETGMVHITAQNHGYAVDADTLMGGLEVSHTNLNDDTVEGLRHRDFPVISIQYHSEASPGPRDNLYLFDRFLEMVRGAKTQGRSADVSRTTPGSVEGQGRKDVETQ
ncbi:MAG: glutamine-hydrolyzing carbamoyl-phosphate synthase small subunit [Chloroflexi bacterium]|nr:glutamine-hydrolyzing carbamoyl-phosphate synthase small subunit [Chloroflexota bacterium]